MTELSIRPDEIAAALRKHVESFRPTVTREEVGRVTETGDGIAMVDGMPSTRAIPSPVSVTRPTSSRLTDGRKLSTCFLSAAAISSGLIESSVM